MFHQPDIFSIETSYILQIKGIAISRRKVLVSSEAYGMPGEVRMAAYVIFDVDNGETYQGLEGIRGQCGSARLVGVVGL